MPTLALINFNIVCATLGGFVSLFGLVSYLCKEQFYLSEARKSGRNFFDLLLQIAQAQAQFQTTILIQIQ